MAEEQDDSQKTEEPSQKKLDEARHLVEMGVARQPDMLECGFGPLDHLEAVHGD